jgi:hypothetical protein
MQGFALCIENFLVNYFKTSRNIYARRKRKACLTYVCLEGGFSAMLLLAGGILWGDPTKAQIHPTSV